jgi:fructose-bisphosphate aldolase class II
MWPGEKPAWSHGDFSYPQVSGWISRKPEVDPMTRSAKDYNSRLIFASNRVNRAQGGVTMPIATPEIYGQMLDRAKAGAFAYPAINVSSSQTVIAAIRGFAEAESDGIIQFSWGGAEYASGSTVKNMVDGAVALAEFAHVVAKNYNVNIAIHTDHCPAEKLDGFMRPLLDFGAQRIKDGKAPLFNSHMWDGSAVDMPENMKVAKELLAKSVAARTILEIEIGVVGGEEDGIEAKHDAKLYSTPEDALLTLETLGNDPTARYMVAATFGNVHGVYKPGNVVLQPKILQTLQEAVSAKLGLAAGSKPMDLVFHGGSGSLLSEIRESLDYGVIKMNIDTDTQYAFTRPVVEHMFKNYDGVLKIDGEVGNKKAYDPRAWGKAAEAGMAARVVQACEDLRSIGTSLRK